MKKTIVALAALALAGCATAQHSTAPVHIPTAVQTAPANRPADPAVTLRKVPGLGSISRGVDIYGDRFAYAKFGCGETVTVNTYPSAAALRDDLQRNQNPSDGSVDVYIHGLLLVYVTPNQTANDTFQWCVKPAAIRAAVEH
jgi:hypothetical protein